MPHLAFTLDQLAALAVFPISHRLALRSRIVLGPEEAEEVAELYARNPNDAAYTLAAGLGEAVEVTRWPDGAWQVFGSLDAALAAVVAHEAEAERLALSGGLPANS